MAFLYFSMTFGFTDQSPPATCGIPILQWHAVLFALFGIRSVASLLKIYVTRHCYRHRNYYNMMRFALIDGLIIAWMMHGNSLYNSKKNDCDRNERTQFLALFMGSAIKLGYVMMIFYALIIGSIPVIYLFFTP